MQYRLLFKPENKENKYNKEANKLYTYIYNCNKW